MRARDVYTYIIVQMIYRLNNSCIITCKKFFTFFQNVWFLCEISEIKQTENCDYYKSTVTTRNEVEKYVIHLKGKKFELKKEQCNELKRNSVTRIGSDSKYE